MGHAGAIASGKGDSAQDKITFLQAHGIEIAPTPAHMGDAMKKAMGAA
jgi:succinyl-CoA synthetase alpha subunit